MVEGAMVEFLVDEHVGEDIFFAWEPDDASWGYFVDDSLWNIARVYPSGRLAAFRFRAIRTSTHGFFMNNHNNS